MFFSFFSQFFFFVIKQIKLFKTYSSCKSNYFYVKPTEYTDTYDRRDKPSVLVTSPSSPDRVANAAAGSSRYANRLTPTNASGGAIGGDSNIGGRIQIKLGFEPGTLQLIVTIICAAGLTYRANGATRNPYAKVNSNNGTEYD